MLCSPDRCKLRRNGLERRRLGEPPWRRRRKWEHLLLLSPFSRPDPLAMAAELIGAVFVGESLAYGCMKLGKAACGVLVGALGLLGKRKHTEDDRASPPASEGPAGAPSSQSTPAGKRRATSRFSGGFRGAGDHAPLPNGPCGGGVPRRRRRRCEIGGGAKRNALQRATLVRPAPPACHRRAHPGHPDLPGPGSQHGGA